MIAVRIGGEDFLRRTINVYVCELEGDDNSRPLRVLSDGHWHDVVDGTQAEPTLVVDHAVGKALLGALHTYFGGTNDNRSLRKDYDAERARVDKLIDAAIR